MAAYYNEIDPYAAQWLRNLIAAGHIAPGDVDTRSISDIPPVDLKGYTQCHFFAGIGVWSYALRRAGWPDDKPVWTGSCPCQPFSVAGANAGMHDQRHLWPDWHWLIEQRRPRVVFGEQVEAAIRHGWLDLVQADMEGIGYAFGAAGVPAAGFGAFHIRQRIYFVADTLHAGRPEGRPITGRGSAASSSSTRELAHHHHQGLEGRGQPERERAVECAAGASGVACELPDGDEQQRYRSGNAGARGRREPADGGAACVMADADGWDASAEWQQSSRQHGQQQQENSGTRELGDAPGVGQRRQEGQLGGVWAAQRSEVDENRGPGSHHLGRTPADWLLCRDGKWRPVEPGTFPLAHGAAARVGRLRAYGNAIDAETAANFIAAYMEARA